MRADDFAGHPPAFVHTADYDPFRDQGRAYAARLSAAGVPVTQTCHAGVIHHYYAMPRVIGRAEAALNDIGGDVARTLASTR